MRTQRVAFGPYLYDGVTGELTRDGSPVALGGRGTAILSRLLAADGGVVAKDALLEAAWPGLAVEEGNLAVQVARLRKALGSRPDGLEWIATVPRTGYRLLRDGGASSAAEIPTLAVLPFQNLGDDPARLRDGLVDAITTALSRFRSFAVIARQSAAAMRDRNGDLRELAAALGARYLLDGSIRRSPGRLRVTAQLLDGRTGFTLWAQGFDGGSEDVFAIEDQLTEAVVGIVAPEILHAEIAAARRRPPANLGAYELYLRATELIYRSTPTSHAEAEALLAEAIALDPGYPMALITAAWPAEHRISNGWPAPPGDRERLLGLVDRALAAAPSDALVMAMASEFLFTANVHDRALPLARRAVALNPHHIFVLNFAGITLLHLGDPDEAHDVVARAISLSPHDPFGHGPLTSMAILCLLRGEHEEAVRWGERSLASNDRYGATHRVLIAADALAGRLDEARGRLARYRAVAPGVTLASLAKGRALTPPLVRIFEGLRRAGMPDG